MDELKLYASCEDASCEETFQVQLGVTMPSKKRAPKDYGIALTQVNRLPEIYRVNIDKEMRRIRDHLGVLIGSHKPDIGAFDIGEFLAKEQEDWNRKKTVHYGNLSWSSVEDLLNAHPAYRIENGKGRIFLIACKETYKSCAPFLKDHPELRDLCNHANSTTIQLRYTELKKYSKDVQGIIAWLHAIPKEEALLVKEIRERRGELSQLGIELLDFTIDTEDVPEPDLVGMKQKTFLSIEVKDHPCDYQAVGEVLAGVNKFREVLEAREAHVQGVIIAREFRPSAYYAALGQPITIIKANMKKNPFVVACIEAIAMTKSDWLKFASA